jgi:flagellum-specific peptidoglycan hydrolase FlgJ
MFKKILPLFAILTLIGCNATKPTIITKMSAPDKANKELMVRSMMNEDNQKKEIKKPKTEVIVSTSKTMVTNDVINKYVSDFKEIAKGNMKNYGIPASIILAQGILESGAGRGDLAATSNNHFGIKCHKDWTGESVRHDDDAEQECFRKYNDPSESYKDHALFLTGRTRYSTLFALEKGDYKAWAKGLKAAGYATDPKYPEKLISYIERYNLTQYDTEVLDVNKPTVVNPPVVNPPVINPPVINPPVVNPPVVKPPVVKPPVVKPAVVKKPETVIVAGNIDKNLHEVKKGDTLYSISKKYNLKVDELKKINNLTANALSIGQKIRIK